MIFFLLPVGGKFLNPHFICDIELFSVKFLYDSSGEFRCYKEGHDILTIISQECPSLDKKCE
jgi:hypothetical protein